MKVLTNKMVYEKRHDLAREIPEVVYIFKKFEKNGECQACDEKTIALTLYNYIIYTLKSKDKELVKKICDKFETNFLIDGKIYSKEEVLLTNFTYQKKEMPSIFYQARGFFASALKVMFRSIICRDRVFSSFFERKIRLTICKSCSSYDYNSKKCSKCGCPMKRKVKFKHAECPRNKW